MNRAPLDDLRKLIRDIPDFPRPGVVFKDITPLLADRDGFSMALQGLLDHFADTPIDKVCGIEARGFIIAAPIAHARRAGFVPIRKVGKLPYETELENYVLEYGNETLEIHRDAIAEGENVLIVDDVLATGGTANAAARLIAKLGGVVQGFGCLVELSFLGGRSRLHDFEVYSLLEF